MENETTMFHSSLVLQIISWKYSFVIISSTCSITGHLSLFFNADGRSTAEPRIASSLQIQGEYLSTYKQSLPSWNLHIMYVTVEPAVERADLRANQNQRLGDLSSQQQTVQIIHHPWRQHNSYSMSVVKITSGHKQPELGSPKTEKSQLTHN